MLERIFHLLTGYAEFEIKGDSARFLNIAAKSGFGFWGFAKREGKALVSCKAREYRRLRPVARRCHVRLHCVRKRGLPFQTRRLWMRKGLLAGALGGAALYAFLGSFLWGVNVSGTELLSDRQILDAARQSGVYEGVPKDSFSPKGASHQIVTLVPGLNWVSVNTDGCFAEIAVGEGEEKPEITDDAKWSNMVASRAGTILKVEAERGRPEVHPGDTVQEGDLLISGLYQEEVDPYGPQPDKPLETLGAARGRVLAETYREFTVQVSAVKRETVPDGRKKVNASLTVFGIRIPLGLHAVPEEECRAYTETSSLTALGVSLPLTLERDVYEFTQESSRALDEEELKAAALLKLREAQKAAVAEGGRIVKEELEYSFPDGLCILSAKCRCEEEISVKQEILVE